MSVLLVLGASSDLGCALIDSVAERYDTIWATYRTMNEKLDALVRKYDGCVRPVHADLSDKEDIKTLIDSISYPDHIVHIPMAPYAVKKFVKTD